MMLDYIQLSKGKAVVGELLFSLIGCYDDS